MLKLKLKKEPSESAAPAPEDTAPPAPPAAPKADAGAAAPKTESASPAPAAAPKSRIKLSLNDKKANPVRLRLRTNKATGDGFDIEAPDREDDPTQEEAIVLRMLPGPALTNLRRAVDTNNFEGVGIKFEDRRHAIVSVADDEFHAQLMDLPTVTEVHKTIDRRNIFKTVDVSQILLVTHRVGDPKPNLHQLTQFTQDPQAFPHGLTPPMHNARNRRFQPRMSTKAVEAVEAQVEELLKRDAEAKEVSTEILPASAVAAQQALAEAARAAAKARTEESDDMDIDDDLDEELERAMMNDDEVDEDEDEDLDEDDTKEPKTAGGAAQKPREDSASEGEEDVDDDDDDEDDDDDVRPGDEERGDVDEDVRQHNKQLREEIRELEVTIQAKERLASSVVNEIMRARHMDAVTRLRSELEKKKSLLRAADGTDQRAQEQEEEDDEDDEEEDDDDDDAPEMPEGAGLPEVPPASSSDRPTNEQLESNAADLRLRDQLSGLNEDDIDIDDLF